MASTARQRGVPRHSRRRSRGPGFRDDIEGMRGLAMILMLLFHAGVGWAGGGYVGLDVFFVISGFLITALIVEEIESTGRVNLPAFYARRARRLLPLAFTVIAATGIAVMIVFDPVRREEAGEDLVAAGAYLINWVLHAEAVDYFAADTEPSVVQHYWSLSVEEQFYLLWPLLLMIVAIWARRHGVNRHRALVRTMQVILAVGLANSLYVAYATDQPGYFSTAVRGWEFAFGGALALGVGVPRRLTARGGAVCAWAGMALLLGAFVVYDPTTLYPGIAVVVPVVATALLIVGGSVRSVPGPTRFLQSGPIRHLGRISYAWYLWHWPMLIIAAEIVGPLSVLEGLLITTGAYLPALLSHWWIEEPFRRSRVLAAIPRRGLGLGLTCTAGCVVLGLMVQVTTPRVSVAQGPVAGAAATTQEVGAVSIEERTVLGPPVQAVSAGVRPDPRRAADDLTAAHADGCLVGLTRTDLRPQCVYGDPGSATTVVMFGDSHMIQYFPAVHDLARKRGWRLVVQTKAGCSPGDVLIYNDALERIYYGCSQWREKALAAIAAERPRMVIVSGVTTKSVIEDGQRLAGDANARALEAGFARTYRTFKRMGATVVAITAFPRPEPYVPGCIAEQGLRRLDRCAVRVADMIVGPPADLRAARRTGVHIVDPRTQLCRAGLCPAVIGDAIVYRRGGHLTATFAATLTPWLRREIPKGLLVT